MLCFLPSILDARTLLQSVQTAGGGRFFSGLWFLLMLWGTSDRLMGQVLERAGAVGGPWEPVAEAVFEPIVEDPNQFRVRFAAPELSAQQQTYYRVLAPWPTQIHSLLVLPQDQVELLIEVAFDPSAGALQAYGEIEVLPELICAGGAVYFVAPHVLHTVDPESTCTPHSTLEYAWEIQRDDRRLAGGEGPVAGLLETLPGRHTVRFEIRSADTGACTPLPLVLTRSVDLTGIEIQSASLADNEIWIDLQPANAYGTLHVYLDDLLVDSFPTPGGPILTGFGQVTRLPRGREFHTIRVEWEIEQGVCRAQFDYRFKVLGTYRHTQYNIPDLSDPTCDAGTVTQVFITDDECRFEQDDLPEPFRAQTAMNGRGRTEEHGVIANEFYCFEDGTPPQEALPEYTFRRQQEAEGACGPVDVDTVAVREDHPDLQCGDEIYIYGVGVKRVTDYCPGCLIQQCDNFTWDPRCTGIVDLGNFPTFKLYSD